MEYDKENQHKMFGTWLRVTELKLDRDALSARWTSVYRIFDNIDYETATFLVNYSFGLSFSHTKLQWLQEEFHSDDTMFIMQASDNPQELKNLTSVLLILLLEDIEPENKELNSIIANYTLAVSCVGLREAAINNQKIVDSAKALVYNYAVNSRERQSFSLSENKSWDQAKINSAIEDVDVTDNLTDQEALRVISNTSKISITAVKNNNKKLSSNIKHLVRIQDEELNILWWLINSYSSLCDCYFDELISTTKPLILGLELAKLTALNVEIPSAKVILKKTGIDYDATFSFSKFIKGVDKLDEIIADFVNDSETNTPILYALKHKTSDDSWFEENRSKIDINNDKEISNIEWALQIYREILACKAMKEYI